MTALAHNHGLHLYRTSASLAANIAGFAAPALREGVHTLLVPTRANREPLVSRLAHLGVDVDAAVGNGRLVLADADALAARCVSEGGVTGVWNQFIDTVDGLRARGATRLAIWGETTDALWRLGQHALFDDLEGRWCTATAADRDIDLLCSSHADPLDEAAWSGTIQRKVALHTHVWHAEGAELLDTWVDHAADIVLGPRMAAMAWTLADKHARTTPGASRAITRLCWLRDQMPSTHARLLTLARALRGQTR